MQIRRLALALPLLAVTSAGAVNDTPHAKALATAHEAWAQGDYIAALNGYIKILNASGGDALHDAIALQTGELYKAFELTADGRAPRFSADGRFIAYESGLEVSRRTRVVRNDPSRTVIAELPGISATFSPAASTVAYLKLVDSPELAAAAKALDDAPLAVQNRNALIQALNYQVLAEHHHRLARPGYTAGA